MRPAYVGPLPLLGLGTVGRLALLESLDGALLVPLTALEAVTTEPARTNLRRWLDGGAARTDIPGDGDYDDAARAVLDSSGTTVDGRLVAAVLEHADSAAGVLLVSDDRRVRTVARGLGADVTGTVGVLVRAVAQGLPEAEAGELLRELDGHGLHLTGRLLETADELLADAAGPGDGGGDGDADGGRRRWRRGRGPPRRR